MALSTGKRYLKNLFAQANKETPVAEKVQKYLNEVYGIKTPENFASKLVMAHREFHGTPFDLSLKLVDAIIDACELWQEYVVDWDALVCQEVLSIVKIHTSVINLGFLNKENVALKKQPSIYRSTTVTLDGQIRFYVR